jgi:hypothetical protein
MNLSDNVVVSVPNFEPEMFGYYIITNTVPILITNTYTKKMHLMK